MSDPRFDPVAAMSSLRGGILWRLRGHGSSTRVTVSCDDFSTDVLGLPLCRGNVGALIDAARRSRTTDATASKDNI
jgi:hypothetical protein